MVEPDYAALDRLVPHPVYARQLWISILNPSDATFRDIVMPLLTEAHDRLAAARARHADTTADAPAGGSLRALDGEHVHEADIGIPGEQLRAGRGQGGRDLPVQVRLTRGFVLEGVEDPEGARRRRGSRTRRAFRAPAPRSPDRP